MPEGDTIYRTAATLRKALLGNTITRFETSVDAVAAVAARTPLAGRVVSAVEPRGKHLLITFGESHRAAEGTEKGRNGQRPKAECGMEQADDGGQEARSSRGFTGASRVPPPLTPRSPIQAPQAALPISSSPDSPIGSPERALGRTESASAAQSLVLHTHLRMHGSWHLYRPGEAWWKPTRLAKVTLYTEEFVAPCFNAPVVELLTEWQARRHPDLVSLGPDAITEEFDALEARQRMRRWPEVEIGVALMNQRAMAGVGNVYKSEALFLSRVSPFLKVGELSDEDLDALIAECHRLLRLNRDRGIRRTVTGLNDRQRLWVYGRGGQPCRVCGGPIRMRRQGIDARSTYYCPKCQAVG